MKRLSNIEESIWSDIQKRSSGETIRKEDDVNLLDITEFYKYLLDRYYILINPLVDRIKMSTSYNYIFTPIIHHPNHNDIIYGVYYSFRFKNQVYIPQQFLDVFPDLEDKIKSRFKIKIRYTITGISVFIKNPDDSECTNKFYIDVIEFLMKNVDDKLKIIEKK
jgi:hypothetical protein